MARLRRVVGIIAVAAVWCEIEAVSFAQQVSSEPRSYVTTGTLATFQPEGDVDGSPHHTGPFGGNSFGIGGTIGRNVSRELALEGRVRFRGTLTKSESLDDGSGVASFTTTYREFAFDGRVRWRTVDHPVSVGPSAGLTMVCGTITHADVVYHPFRPPFIAKTLPDDTSTDCWFGVGFGLDAALGIAKHVSIVPSFNGYWLPNRQPPPDGPIGVSTHGFDVGVGIGFQF